MKPPTEHRLVALALAALSPFFAAAPAAAKDVIPAVPAAVLEGAGETPRENGAGVLTVTPGVNQIIPIAIAHPNRLVTPFAAPEVVSTTLTGADDDGRCGELCIRENVVYVATDKTRPVTLFITEKGSQARALSLTLIPRRIPPREIFLAFAAGAGNRGGANPAAKAWEESRPYTATIRALFRALALGEIPRGYAIDRVTGGAVPVCTQAGVAVDFSAGQSLSGHHLKVFVGLARNLSSRPVEIEETFCAGDDVVAVAAWPSAMLAPRRETEIFVAKKAARRPAPSRARPSLLEGGR